MKICKYCKKPILDNCVWNPDSEGNGYHHACLCEMEFRSRDRQIYDKGKADVLDKIRAEIIKYEADCRLSVDEYPSCKQCTDNVFETIYRILNKYKTENEVEDKVSQEFSQGRRQG